MQKKTIFIFQILLMHSLLFAENSQFLGINLSGIVDWGSAWPFVDIMKNARDWIPFNADGSGDWTSGVEVPTDAYGYPVEIPFDPDGSGGIPPQAVRTIVLSSFEDFPVGDYSLIFEGTGSITLGGDASGTYTEPNVVNHFKMSSYGNGGIILTITQSSTSDPVKNIRIIMPGYETTYEDQIFHPLFLDRLRGFKVLRFMDWGKTNDNPVSEWADRTTSQYFSQAVDNGVALEYMVALANRLDADPWFCIPHEADDDYVREFAHLVHIELNLSSKVYIEYSNELWNGQFQQTGYVQDQGIALGLSSDRFQAGLFYNSKRSAEIFNIFEQEFGGTDRLVRVIASQAANSWTGEQVLKGLEDSSINPTSSKADALAVAPYFGGSIANDIVSNNEVYSISINEILNRAGKDVYTQTAVWAKENKKVAEEYGVILIAYEGGQHLVGTGGNENIQVLNDKLVTANRDVKMRDIYLQMFSVWFQNGGGLFSVFNSCERPSKWGSWGILEYQNQSISDAPKYEAVQQILYDGLNGINVLKKPINLRIKSQ